MEEIIMAGTQVFSTEDAERLLQLKGKMDEGIAVFKSKIAKLYESCEQTGTKSLQESSESGREALTKYEELHENFTEQLVDVANKTLDASNM